MGYLQTAEDFTTEENRAVTYAVLAVAIELKKMRERTAFTLPSGNESINLERVQVAKVNPYADTYEVLLYVDACGPAWDYHGEDAKALAKVFGLKGPKTGGE